MKRKKNVVLEGVSCTGFALSLCFTRYMEEERGRERGGRVGSQAVVIPSIQCSKLF
jgi:hypothetical protein